MIRKLVVAGTLSIALMLTPASGHGASQQGGQPDAPHHSDQSTRPLPKPVVNAQGIPELPLIAPNYNRKSMLLSGKIPADNGKDPVGAFRLICAPSHLSYDDPIVYPDQPGKSHLHLFFGNDRSDASSTYKSLRSSGSSTCGLLNRSAYWMPAMLDGHGHVVLPNFATVYYKRVPASDPWCQPGQVSRKGCTGLPRGLRYIFGRTMSGGIYPTVRSDDVNFTCNSPKLSGHDFAKVASQCQPGATLGVQIVAPDCWNGKDLDSPDHRAHMATIRYGNDGKGRCPDAFPYLLPKFTFDTWFTVPPGGLADAMFSSDREMGLPPGTTLHADWIGAWDDQALKTWESKCIDGHKNGSGGSLCDGTKLVGAQQPEYGWKQPHLLIPLPKPGTSTVVQGSAVKSLATADR